MINILYLVLILLIIYIIYTYTKEYYTDTKDLYTDTKDLYNDTKDLYNDTKDLYTDTKEKQIITYSNRKIHIWQAEWEKSIKLEFMYKPIVSSVIELLKYSNYNIDIDFKVNNYNFDDIKENEILIWVGCISIPDFNHLRNKKIYTIYYDTEPDTNIRYSSDEIWTYSKYLFNNYKKQFEKQIIKFVPIILEENIPSVPYNILNENIKLSFIGHLDCRSEKINKISTNIEEINNLWNDEKYNEYIKSNSRIYLNLTKSYTYVLPSVRINKLLSHKCIIISEHTNDIDEEYYKDMVYFCNIDDINKVYENLLKKSNIELQNEANEKYKKFYDKFYLKNAHKLIEEK